MQTSKQMQQTRTQTFSIICLRMEPWNCLGLPQMCHQHDASPFPGDKTANNIAKYREFHILQEKFMNFYIAHAIVHKINNSLQKQNACNTQKFPQQSVEQLIPVYPSPPSFKTFFAPQTSRATIPFLNLKHIQLKDAIRTLRIYQRKRSTLAFLAKPRSEHYITYAGRLKCGKSSKAPNPFILFDHFIAGKLRLWWHASLLRKTLQTDKKLSFWDSVIMAVASGRRLATTMGIGRGALYPTFWNLTFSTKCFSRSILCS